MSESTPDLSAASTANLNIRRSNGLSDIDTNPWLISKAKILKNLFAISFAWVLLFTAFQATANLQSSLNSDQGLGTAACMYNL